MKQLILRLSIILIWIISFNIMSDAQTKSSQKENTIKTQDTCGNIAIKKDTIFYPDLDEDQYKNARIEFEQLPEFPGGEKALNEYIQNNVNYPQSAVKDSIYGKVVVIFLVNESGCTENIKIFRSVRKDLDDECIRVVIRLPRFKPGTFLTKSPKGWYWKPINVWFSVQINFLLNEDKNAKGIKILPKYDFAL